MAVGTWGPRGGGGAGVGKRQGEGRAYVVGMEWSGLSGWSRGGVPPEQTRSWHLCMDSYRKMELEIEVWPMKLQGWGFQKSLRKLGT